MDNSRVRQESLRFHMLPLGIFLAFVICIMLVFFYFVEKDIEKNTENTIKQNVEHQSKNFQNIINLQFQYLEGTAQYIGMQGNPGSQRNLILLNTLSRTCDLTGLVVIYPDGTCTSGAGMEGTPPSGEYFQKSMAGERALSGPIENQKEGLTRIILSVPITHRNEIIGVLAGSYDVSALGQRLLGDIYSGAGYILIATADGHVISSEGDQAADGISPNTNFLDYLDQVTFSDGYSAAQIRDDFSAQQSSFVRFRMDDASYYIAYEPLQTEDWLFCYVAPVTIAEHSYRFITDYGIFLFVALAIGTFLLFLVVFYYNSRTREELLQVSQTDALTGMLNKKSAEDQIQNWLEGETPGGIHALLMMDIDKFKEINDVYGHAVGDTILHRFGAMIRSEFREGDIIGRIGGDEFCVLMKNIGYESNAVSKAKNLCQHIANFPFEELGGRPISVSIGIAFAPSHGSSFAELYRHADTALYETKRRGKNGYSLYQA